MAQRSKLLDFESCLDKLFQSALADLSDDLIEYIRLHPSANELHFTLGLYLRNKFIYPEEAYGAFDPDSLSDEIVHELIKRCIPEFKDYKLVYDQLESEPLYSAYRYCLKVKGTFPLEEFTKHYNLLLKAKEISEANPYSLFDDDHYGKRLARANRAQDERERYTQETLHEIWNFTAILEDLGIETAATCEEICLKALSGDQKGFMPSEIAYAMAGCPDYRGMQAFAWAFDDCNTVDYLPDILFERRDLALAAVKQNGLLLERTKLFQDDDEVVMVAVTSRPRAVKFASKRLQNDRDILIAAATNSNDDLVFSVEPMARHNDDDELVGLAIDANGANIAYASERIRGDFDWAMRALLNKRGIYPFESYECLDDHLKRDKRIALAVAEWDDLPSEFPEPSLSDDDDLGLALSKHEDGFALFGMSKRIKSKYMTEEEFELWSDDPWWWESDSDFPDDKPDGE